MLHLFLFIGFAIFLTGINATLHVVELSDVNHRKMCYEVETTGDHAVCKMRFRPGDQLEVTYLGERKWISEENTQPVNLVLHSIKYKVEVLHIMYKNVNDGSPGSTYLYRGDNQFGPISSQFYYEIAAMLRASCWNFDVTKLYENWYQTFTDGNEKMYYITPGLKVHSVVEQLTTIWINEENCTVPAIKVNYGLNGQPEMCQIYCHDKLIEKQYIFFRDEQKWNLLNTMKTPVEKSTLKKPSLEGYYLNDTDEYRESDSEDDDAPAAAEKVEDEPGDESDDMDTITEQVGQIQFEPQPGQKPEDLVGKVVVVKKTPKEKDEGKEHKVKKDEGKKDKDKKPELPESYQESSDPLAKARRPSKLKIRDDIEKLLKKHGNSTVLLSLDDRKPKAPQHSDVSDYNILGMATRIYNLLKARVSFVSDHERIILERKKRHVLHKITIMRSHDCKVLLLEIQIYVKSKHSLGLVKGLYVKHFRNRYYTVFKQFVKAGREWVPYSRMDFINVKKHLVKRYMMENPNLTFDTSFSELFEDIQIPEHEFEVKKRKRHDGITSCIKSAYERLTENYVPVAHDLMDDPETLFKVSQHFAMPELKLYTVEKPYALVRLIDGKQIIWVQEEDGLGCTEIFHIILPETKLLHLKIYSKWDPDKYYQFRNEYWYQIEAEEFMTQLNINSKKLIGKQFYYKDGTYLVEKDEEEDEDDEDDQSEEDE